MYLVHRSSEIAVKKSTIVDSFTNNSTNKIKVQKMGWIDPAGNIRLIRDATRRFETKINKCELTPFFRRLE
jgi:hypothetical protein